MKTRFRFQISDFRFRIASVTLLFLSATAGSLTFAAAPPRSANGQLQDTGNSKAGDDYDRELLGDSIKSAGKGSVDEEMRKKLERELGSAAQKEDKSEDPLLQIAKEMREAQQRLDRRDSGKVTQYLQRQIVSDLDKMIEQAKKSGTTSGMKSGGPKSPGKGDPKLAQTPGPASEPPGQPAKDSDLSPRTPEETRATEAGKKEARDRMLKSFNKGLQGHDREHVLELPSEYFLPEYEREIEDYFRRLSDDKPETGRP